MLIPRLLAAIFLIPLVVFALFFVSLPNFDLILLGIAALSAWEWAQFLQIKLITTRIIFSLCFSILIFLANFMLTEQNQPNIFNIILLFSLAWWIFALLLVITYPSSTSFLKNKIVKLFSGVFTLVPFIVGMKQIRSLNYDQDPYYGAFLLLYVLVLVWATDSGAYFCGRAFGKHKLAPSVSPGKTIEGLIGGVTLSLFVAVLIYLIHYFSLSLVAFFVSSIFAIFVSVLGDLVESMFKRDAQIKDSGHLIPGHGGILDRIDSLTAAIPVFAAIAFFLF